MEIKYFNRELSWIEFNERILNQALNKNFPLLERLQFLSIVSSNFDEFFQVRVASVKRESLVNPDKSDISDLTPKLLLKSISMRTHQIVRQQQECLINEILPNIELENFVHGAQCMSFSGRCLLSDYFTEGERGANHGNCYQPCRWSYELVSKDRDTARCEVVDTPRGSHIMSTKDLCLVKYLPELIKSGTNSLKIEGRTKSLYYVSAVAKVYRQAIDEAYENPAADMEKYYNELLKVGNRGYTTGFALGKHPSDGYSYDISSGLAGADFLFEFLGEEKDGFYKVKIKNKTNLNDEIEIISPSEQFMTKVLEIRDKDFVEIPLGNTNDEIFMKFATSPVEYKYALARTLGIKNPQKDKENVCS